MRYRVAVAPRDGNTIPANRIILGHMIDAFQYINVTIVLIERTVPPTRCPQDDTRLPTSMAMVAMVSVLDIAADKFLQPPGLTSTISGFSTGLLLISVR